MTVTVPIYLPATQISPEETISSLLDRAGAHYGVDGVTFGEALLEKAVSSNRSTARPILDWDNPPDEVLDIVADACHISPRELASHAIPDGPRWLAAGCRTAWCPQCMLDDLGFRAPHFRRHWALVAETFCDRHNPPQPLLNWPPQNHNGAAGSRLGGRALPSEWVTDRVIALSCQEQQKRQDAYVDSLRSEVGMPVQLRYLLSDLYDMESSIDYTLRRTDYPRYQMTSDTNSKGIQRRLGGLLQPERDFISNLISLSAQAGELLPGKERWIWRPRTATISHRMSETLDSAWEVFRRNGSPAARRAVFWLTACTECRNLQNLCQQIPVFITTGGLHGACIMTG